MDKFNREKFLYILNEIKSRYESQNKMAAAMGLSSAYFTKLFDKNTKKPPAPEYLKKISDNSKGITTYEELMKLCGYLNISDYSNTYIYESFEKNFNKTRTSLLLFLTNEQMDEFYNLIKNEITNLISGRDSNSIDIILEEYVKRNKLNEQNKFDIFVIALEIIKNSDTTLKTLTNFYSKIKDGINATEIIQHKKGVKIPVLGRIPAGIPIEMVDDILSYEDISEQMLKGGKQYFALKVNGDSMYPDYHDGDTLIVLKQNNCENGDDAIVTVNFDDATFKRVYKNENGITLQPLNNKYPPVFYSNDDILNKPITILGVVIEFRRKIK